MWLIILLFFIYVIYKYLYMPLWYWDKKNVPYAKPLPIFGNMLGFVIGKRSNTETNDRIYKMYPNERCVGMYNFNSPVLMITDPELTKTILVKEFDTFPDHRPLISPDIDPIWNKNLFAMEGGEKWHDLRSTLSPSFTSSKMRTMFVLMKESASQYVNYYKRKSDGVIDVELKDSFARFANDVIATTAFGVTCDSLSNPENEFYSLAKEFGNIGGVGRLRNFLILLNVFSPTLAKLTRIPLIPKKVRHFFTTTIKYAIKLREEKKIVRPDMLNLLIESQKGRSKIEEADVIPEAGFAAVEESNYGKTKEKIQITDDIIIAQVLIFFIGGFDTVSTMMSYAIYELAINPEVQEKLRKEIDTTLKKSNGELTYENLMSMQYLDGVVSETLRKWPPFPATDRRSVKPYVIKAENPGERDIHLDDGTVILFPIFSIHRDPKHYPNPEKFNPERFTEENKLNINRHTYLPFGIGPRNCIASRFALLEGKLIISEIIKNFEVVVISKTEIPISFSKKNFTTLPDSGIWVGLRKRTDVI